MIGDGCAFFEAVRQAGLEGMVAKRRSSQYVGTLTADWLKVKCVRTYDFVIGGWLADSAGAFNSLLLGEFIDGDLRYLGRVQNNLARLALSHGSCACLHHERDHRSRTQFRKPAQASVSRHYASGSNFRI